MNFEEAMKKMRNAISVRRKGWASKLVMVSNEIVIVNDGQQVETWEISMPDVMATDWEIV